MTKTPEEIKELKAYCFSLYYGQNVCTDIVGKHTINVDGTLLLGGLNDLYLQPRPLSSINSDEAKEFIAIALSDPQNEYEDSGDISSAEVHIESIDKTEVETRFDVSVRCWEGLVIYSSLRGIFYTVSDEDTISPIFTGSILIEWMRQHAFASSVFYKGTHYTVEQLTELGIIALK